LLWLELLHTGLLLLLLLLKQILLLKLLLLRLDGESGDRGGLPGLVRVKLISYFFSLLLFPVI